MSLNNDTSKGSDLVRQWYLDHYNALISFLHSRFGAGPPEPEDIAQRTFARLLDHPTLNEVANPRAFLWRIAHNMVVSEHRSSKTAERGLENLSLLSSVNEGYLLVPERVLAAQEQIRIAVRVLERMPEKRRTVFLMVRIDGLSQSEVASRLNITPPAVSKHVGKATAELYDALMRDPVLKSND